MMYKKRSSLRNRPKIFITRLLSGDWIINKWSDNIIWMILSSMKLCACSNQQTMRGVHWTRYNNPNRDIWHALGRLKQQQTRKTTIETN